MEWFPGLAVGWLNGWLLLVAFYGVFGVMMWAFPREVVARLYDRTGWGREVQVNAAAAKVLAFVLFGLAFFTPLQIGTTVFWVGTGLYGIGFALMVISLLNYRNTPFGEPVVDGAYRFSRNPQWVALVLVVLGIPLAMGSGIALLLAVAITILGHLRVIAEEKACLEAYGESYRDYMEGVPRYLGFFWGEGFGL